MTGQRAPCCCCRQWRGGVYMREPAGKRHAPICMDDGRRPAVCVFVANVRWAEMLVYEEPTDCASEDAMGTGDLIIIIHTCHNLLPYPMTCLRVPSTVLYMYVAVVEAWLSMLVACRISIQDRADR